MRFVENAVDLERIHRRDRMAVTPQTPILQACFDTNDIHAKVTVAHPAGEVVFVQGSTAPQELRNPQ